jgi:hypothetical protein
MAITSEEPKALARSTNADGISIKIYLQNELFSRRAFCIIAFARGAVFA